MKKRILLAATIIAAVVAGCDDQPSTVGTTSAERETATASAGDALPANLRLTSAPAGAQDIAGIKTSVKDGDRITVRGTVAGREDPIAENRAILTLLDSSIKTCDANPADGCTTPWDACCEPADVLATNSVTVQVVDGEGRPLKTSLAGIDGVKPLAQLVVSGTAEVSADGVVLLNADGVHVLEGPG